MEFCSRIIGDRSRTMKRNRRTHSPAFKATVAMEERRGEETAGLSRLRYDTIDNRALRYRSTTARGDGPTGFSM